MIPAKRATDSTFYPRTKAETFLYAPFGEITTEYNINFGNNVIPKYSFNAKELDEENGMYYYEARYYAPPTFTSRDPLFEKYFWMSPYAYCANNPVKYVDPSGEEWEDADGNIIKDHSKVKVYIFYDPNSFKKQSMKMYENAEKKYGKGSVALSKVTTKEEFAQDWENMASPDIKEVNLNYHGKNQTLILKSTGEYITSTGNGKSQESGTLATNVSDLPTPKGNISKAQLNINSCHSNGYVKNGQNLMQAFVSTFAFKQVRGTSAGVSYNRTTMQPEPQFFFQHWDYSNPTPQNTRGPVYYNTGGMR